LCALWDEGREATVRKSCTAAEREREKSQEEEEKNNNIIVSFDSNISPFLVKPATDKRLLHWHTQKQKSVLKKKWIEQEKKKWEMSEKATNSFKQRKRDKRKKKSKKIKNKSEKRER